MKSLIKLLLGLVGLAVVVLIAVVITVATLDPNDHKDWLSEKALEQTGRTLNLGGDLGLTFYPWLGLEANDVAVGNAAGFGEQPFLRANYIKLRIKLLPILKDQYEIDTVIIRGAEINLARNKEGISNWDDLVKEEKSDSTFPLAAVVLGGVDIQKASVSWNDQSTDTRYDVTNMDIRTDALKYGEPLSLTVDMDAKANRPAIAGKINLGGTIAYDLDKQLYNIRPLQLTAEYAGDNVPGGKSTATFSAGIDLDLDKDTATISDLNLDVLGTQVKGMLNAGGIQTAGPTVKTTLSVAGKDLALLFKVAEIEPLATHIATLKDRSFTLETSIDADSGRGDVDVPTLSLAMLGATVEGNVKARNMVSATPEYAGQLKAAGPDLPMLLKVLGQFQGGKDSTLSQYADTLASGKHKAFKVDASFDADMKAGNIDVSRLALELIGATVNGHVNARNVFSDSPDKKGQFKGQLNAAGPDLPTLLQVLGKAQGGDESSLGDYGRKFARLKEKAFRINADFDADLDKGNIELPTLDVDTLGIQVKGNLRSKNMLAKDGSINGKVSIKGKNLNGLLAALEQQSLADMLHAIDIEADIAGNAGKMNLQPLTMKAMVATEQMGKVPVEVLLRADTNIDFDKETLDMAGLSLKGLGLDISGKINATKILQAPAASGQLNVARFDLRTLMKRLGKELPVTADKKVFTSLGFSTGFDGSAGMLELKDLKVALDQSKLAGNFSLNDFDKPAIRFGLTVDDINLDRYLAPVDKAGAKKPVTPETAAGAAAQLPLETLQALNIKGDLSIGKLVISNARLSNIKLSLDGKDGKIKLAPVAANLYQGTYAGDISIDANDKLPKLVVNSSIKGVQIEPLLKDFTGNADLVGKSDISIAVVARGRDTDTFKQTLSGQAELKVVNGIVRGIDVGSALEQVEIMLESKRFGKVNTEGNTPFKSLTATLPINAGIVNNSDLLLTAPGFRVSGKGTLARLIDMTWNYDLRVDVDERSVAKNNKNYNIGDYNIPINCRGKIEGKNCKPDITNLASVAMKKIILDKLTLPGNVAGEGAKAVDQGADQGKELLDKALKSIFK